MALVGRLLDHIAKRAWWAVRWFAHEFLWIAARPSAAAVLISIARLVGLSILLAVGHLSMSDGLAPGMPQATTHFILALLLAVSLGNLAKECTVTLCARALALLGRDFLRRGATLDGKHFCETFYADGTWIRCESGPEATVCEWTDGSGAINRIVTRPRAPPRI
jgi:hypothetical protein